MWRGRRPLSIAMAVFFGFHMPNYTFPGVADGALFGRVLENARAAEAAGFDLVTVMDHSYQIRGVGPETDPMLEPYTTLAALAAQTQRVKLATLVTGVTYRNPALVAKMVTTIDVISNGRAILGLGAAWNESEHRGYGFEFPPIGERMDRLDEALKIIKLMFTEERPSFEGKHYRIQEALNRPRPVQTGGPRIMIGGTGEKRTLRLLARHGDIGHWFGAGLDEIKRKQEIFERHCEVEGRDPKSVLLTMGAGVVLVEHERDAKSVMDLIPAERRPSISAATPAQAAEMLGKYLEAGIGGFTLSNQTLRTPEAIGLGGELIKLMRGRDS
ncbi:MAG: LLM class F420-dependent oxidoreductase [Candidatus Dormibacterales bacterium]